jgi:uncharacterized membrane protein YdjX (TVP38/TMEM64 family)
METTGKTPARTPLISRLVPFIMLVGAAAVIWGSGALDFISLQKLAEHRETLQSFVAENIVLAMAGYAVLYAVVVALSLPVAAPLTLAGGFLFGWFVGGLVTVMAATLGAVVIFLLARGALAGPLSRMAGPRLDRLRKGFQENALSYLLFLRLVPAFPFWLVNLAPALLGVPLRTYVIATFLGIIPGTFAFALTGAGLDSVLLAQQQAYEECVAQNASADACTFDLDPANLLTPELLLAFAALGVVALIPAIVKKVWKDKPGAG